LLQLRTAVELGHSPLEATVEWVDEAAAFEACQATSSKSRWTPEKAQLWYKRHGWAVGANFIPSTAVNTLEMWQSDTFDESTIDGELGFAAGLGMSIVRVFLHDLVYSDDSDGLLHRIHRFLEIAARHGISTMFVLFDGCWKPEAHLGQQPTELPHVHKSQWVQAPSKFVLDDVSNWSILKAYVQGIIGHFRNDSRVHSWDLYNEVDNVDLEVAMGNHFNISRSTSRDVQLRHKLLCNSFKWARAMLPEQPLHAGEWDGASENVRWLLRNVSDIGNLHSYSEAYTTNEAMKKMKKFYQNRPVNMTEYMARPIGSTFEAILPVAHQHDIGAINWGLVRGKTNTVWPWASWSELVGEPSPWFHDIFWPDGTAYDLQEVTTIRKFTNASGYGHNTS
jgi:hypothetical protein